jgi:hypothetical protein
VRTEIRTAIRKDRRRHRMGFRVIATGITVHHFRQTSSAENIQDTDDMD